MAYPSSGGYVPMEWELGPDQTRYTRNIAAPGQPPYYVALTLSPAEQVMQAQSFIADITGVPTGPTSPTLVPFHPPMNGSPTISPGYNPPAYDSPAGEIFTIGGSYACAQIQDAALRAACEATVRAIGGGGGGGNNTLTTTTTGGNCPVGFHPDPSGSGVCLSDVSPAGYGTAVMGRYGAALSPLGIVRQTRLCPRGSVLGDDGLCYNKGTKGAQKQNRLWPPGTKPLLTGGQVKILRQAKALEKKVRRLAGKYAPKRRQLMPGKKKR